MHGNISLAFWKYDSDFTLKLIVVWFAELELCLHVYSMNVVSLKSFWGHNSVVLDTSILGSCLSVIGTGLKRAFNYVYLTWLIEQEDFSVSLTLHILQEWFVFIVQEKIILYITIDVKHRSLFQGSYMLVIISA
jgi:hypothetical protein